MEHELTGALDRYRDEIRSAVLYGLEQQTNPTNIASLLYRATKAADEDWRLIAQTEVARANALGRLDGCEKAGYGEVWIPPHAGSCRSCKRLIENRVFPVEQLRNAVSANYKQPQRLWVPALPQHPRCRHTAVPWVREIYETAQQEYVRMRDLGLDDETLDAMFDSSGQLRPQYEGDERLAALFAGKTVTDPFDYMLSEVVSKLRNTGITVSKGFFDPPHAGLDPLIWEDDELKPTVRQGILSFWTSVLGEGWVAWSKVYITGSATSYQWGTGWHHPWLGSHQQPTAPDVDTHLVIDYTQAREKRPMWSGMSPMELRKLIEAWASKAKTDVEVAPGLRLDAYVRMEQSEREFEHDVRATGQGVYDVTADKWLITPTHPEDGETFGERPLGGLGGHIAAEKPDWVTFAEQASTQLQSLLDAYQAQPSEATLQALQDYMDVLYADRKAAFLEGSGQDDRGNFVWQWLDNFGPLVDVKDLLHRTPGP